jgi:MYXO-CTERM domain-containing protein
VWRFEAAIPAGALALTLAGTVYLVPTQAQACGGTFCDAALPTSMPVDQTGETILFALDNGYVEAHVQIDYDGGDANEFAWLVPVPEIPEVEVGSWRLVQAVLDGTRPVYGVENLSVCEDSSADSGVAFLSRPDGGGTSTGEDPVVVAESVVGAFQYAILQGGTAETVTQWLLDNGYTVEEEAPTILDDYITEGHVFVAFRLRHGQGVEDIHPVVIRYPGSEPCIPIRLTRVAAKEDMDIRAIFLGEARAVPTNYRGVLLNRTRLDWPNFGPNYRELVTMAVDAPMADGRAFVTEYAGTTAVIDGSPLDTSMLDASVFETGLVVDVIETLEAMGVMLCDDEQCLWLHELAPSLVHEFLPVPEGVDEHAFYSCLSCYAGLIDAAAWDATAFAAAFQERIVAPMQHGQELLATWPYVTRLYTTISPHEMTMDPMFAENDTLADVPSRYGAERQQECCGDVMRLPGGRMVWMLDSAWPQWSDAMPWAERVEEYAAAGGAPIVLVDETATIDALIDEWNAVADCNGPGETSGSDTGLDDGGSDGPLGDDEGNSSVGGTTSGGTTSDDPGADDEAVSSCSCVAAPVGRGWTLMLLGLGLGALTRRRRS